MNVKIFITLVNLLLLTQPILAQTKEQDEWYPFVLADHIDPHSPVNIGKRILDAPAGKHGFVKVKDGHFYFEDGTKIRFWGTNLTFNSAFPDKKQAEEMAERLVFFGFNAVRLHHMDSSFEPRGIFEDICPAFKNSQAKKTGHLSKKQMDRLDYLIYVLKQRGIYIDINLLVSRRFTEADGVVNASELGPAAKPASIFDPHLIELQKKYAKDLLTHYNPYTKLKYNEDPVIALIEITNENSIFDSFKKIILDGNKNFLPSYYSSQLDAKWNDWLKKKYGTVDNVKNAWKEDAVNLDFPSQSLLQEKDWQTEKHQEADMSINEKDGIIEISIKKRDAEAWNLQLKKTDFPLKKNKLYEINFLAKADRTTHISLWIVQNVSPYSNLGFSEEIELTGQWKNFQYFFEANQNFDKSRFSFVLGQTEGNIVLKDISLAPIRKFGLTPPEEKLTEFMFSRQASEKKILFSARRVEDLQAFYISIEKEYTDEMLSYLKDTLAIKVPVTGIGGYSYLGDLSVLENSDFIDTHHYWDHPRFPNKPWDENDFSIHNKSMLQDKAIGIIGEIISRQNTTTAVFNKPFTLTEWNHCYPNKYAYETPILIAAEANKNNWDALFQFSYSNGWNYKPIYDHIRNYFEISSNSQQLILASLGGLIFHDGKNIKETFENGVIRLDSSTFQGIIGNIQNRSWALGPITITSEEPGAIAIFPSDNEELGKAKRIVLVAVGEVKNKNSGWKNNKFFWGDTPVLLKKLPIQATFQTAQKITVYALDKEGERSMKIGTNKTKFLTTFSTKKINSPWFEIAIEE